ncbi:Putative permease [Idiomarina sp. A28L]|uniref:AEC family transporter n=1 Tax=Idiomarina sp. A28L TaxID=1036674 RepID=UPI00021389DD|nr:AEC family transporter [Idiomarina sp. A28L]EGN74523.1 Putative permease [Idiomarina sp. A28L]
MSAMLLILAYLAIGLVLKRTHLMPVNTGQVLNQYVINVAVPAMILLHLPHLDITRAILTPAIMPWVLFPISIGLVLLSAKVFKWSRELTGALLIVVPLGNTSFLGFPMVETFFGTAGLPYAVIYDQVGSFIGLAFFATFFAALYGKREDGSDERLSKASMAKRLLTFPPVIALVVALLFGMETYPGVLETLISNLAATLVPVVMIAVGFQLQFRIPRSDLLPFSIAMVIKLLILPAVAFAIIRLFNLNDLAAQVTVLEASMPFMITAGAVAISAGLKPRFVASLVGYGILIGLVTVPIWAWILKA